jgi:hypothetical protein
VIIVNSKVLGQRLATYQLAIPMITSSPQLTDLVDQCHEARLLLLRHLCVMHTTTESTTARPVFVLRSGNLIWLRNPPSIMISRKIAWPRNIRISQSWRRQQ